MPVTLFRQCTIEDLEVLQAFSRKCYYDTFASLNTPENMQAYLDEAYATEKLRAELLDPACTFVFLYLDDKLAGYLKLNEAAAQTDVHDEASLEIERIYVSQDFQGAGLGRLLMTYALDFAAEKRFAYVWLGVWEKNARAIRFYERNGFRKFATHVFVMGDDAQTDWLMRKDLAAMREYAVAPCSGVGFDVKKGEKVSVIDVEGEQVADFFAVCAEHDDEFLSTAVTLDCNESIRLHVGDTLYTNRYRPMFRIVRDDVGEHDILFPSCRRETYDFFYGNGEGHPNCFDNLNEALSQKRYQIQPVNLFMSATIAPDGKVTIHPARSKAGDSIVLDALSDARVAVAACSVSEGACNGGRCTGVKIVVTE